MARSKPKFRAGDYVIDTSRSELGVGEVGNYRFFDREVGWVYSIKFSGSITCLEKDLIMSTPKFSAGDLVIDTTRRHWGVGEVNDSLYPDKALGWKYAIKYSGSVINCYEKDLLPIDETLVVGDKVRVNDKGLTHLIGRTGTIMSFGSGFVRVNIDGMDDVVSFYLDELEIISPRSSASTNSSAVTVGDTLVVPVKDGSVLLVSVKDGQVHTLSAEVAKAVSDVVRN